MTKSAHKKNTTKRRYVMFAVVLVSYLLFIYWVGSWWGLLVVPFIFDAYITKKIPWSWWRTSKKKSVRVVMGWVDAIVFALVAVYFLNQFFFQNYVIPSSSLEKTLLTGDYLLVSKVSYGPRIPQTPLYMPLTQHTMPLTGTKSYLEHPHWDYRRVKGFGTPQLGDIVVFNYPAGDTVALNIQNQDFYRVAYELGDQILGGISETVTDSMTYNEQQAVFSKIFQAGKSQMALDNYTYGEIVSRPTDRRENYVKRCVGLPGQTLKIVDDVIYLDDKPMFVPENVQQSYFVTFTSYLGDNLKRELGITNEDLSVSIDGSTYVMPLTKRAKEGLEKCEGLVSSIVKAPSADRWLYPLNKRTKWTTSSYGPIWIPKKGATITLTLDKLPIYERPIAVYEGNTLAVKDGKIYINGKQTDKYTFKMDYYWMQGDNRDNSADSRFWGFVPEDHIVGKPLFIWMSLDPDYELFDGKIRWSRLFKWVGDIK